MKMLSTHELDSRTNDGIQAVPFHQYAEDHGTYVLAERAREADHARPEDPLEGPSENTD